MKQETYNGFNCFGTVQLVEKLLAKPIFGRIAYQNIWAHRFLTSGEESLGPSPEIGYNTTVPVRSLKLWGAREEGE